MTPIRPGNRDRYPENWRELSAEVRFDMQNHGRKTVAANVRKLDKWKCRELGR